MLIEDGNLWKYPDTGAIGIPTNGIVQSDAHTGNYVLVMGKGVALAAVEHYPKQKIRAMFGLHVHNNGNIAAYWKFPVGHEMVTLLQFPTKNDWRDPADLDLIIASAKLAQKRASEFVLRGKILLPSPGCGNGGLKFEAVSAALAPILSDQFVLLRPKKEGRE